jgi:circadian clock protein KaiB
MTTKSGKDCRFRLVLYVAGESITSESAIANLQKIEAGFGETLDIQVIYLEITPHRGEENGVNLTPTLVRTHPKPIRKLIGDLSDHDKVILFLKKGIEEGTETVS